MSDAFNFRERNPSMLMPLISGSTACLGFSAVSLFGRAAPVVAAFAGRTEFVADSLFARTAFVADPMVCAFGSSVESPQPQNTVTPKQHATKANFLIFELFIMQELHLI